MRQCSSSPSNSPLTARFKKRPSVEIYSPRPARPQPGRAFPYGLNCEYEIEPFRPAFATPEQMDISYSSDLPEATPLPPAPIFIPPPSYTKPVPPLPKEARNVRSLSLSQYDVRREPGSSREHAISSRPSGPVSGQSFSLPSPSPLGDWPRQDVMQLPAKAKRKPTPPSAFEFPKKHLASMASTDRAPSPADMNPISTSVTQPRPRRPSGPRQRVPSGESGHRPAPLNLYGINSQAS